MKKLGYIVFCLFFTCMFPAAASSVVTLSGGGVVAPLASLNISLNGLVATVNYSVVCYIDTSFPFQYVRLGSQFGDPTSAVTSYSLNGNYVTQDQLIPGHNIAVINGHFTDPSTGFVVFTNLDTVNPFNVTNCFAMPIPVMS